MRKFWLFMFAASLSAGLIPWAEVHAQLDPDRVLLRSPTKRPVVVDLRVFENWTVKCTKGTPESLLPGIKVKPADEQVLRDCRAVTLLAMNKSPLLPVRLIFSIIDKRTKIRILAFVPPRFALTNINGPTLKIGTKTIALHSMRRCTPVSCASFADVPIAELTTIENAKSMALVLPDLPGTKALEFNIPSPGVGQALEAVRKMAPRS